MFKRMTLNTFQEENLIASDIPKRRTNIPIRLKEDGYLKSEFTLRIPPNSVRQIIRKLILDTMARIPAIFRTDKKPVFQFNYAGNNALILVVTFWLELSEEEENNQHLVQIQKITIFSQVSEVLNDNGFSLSD